MSTPESPRFEAAEAGEVTDRRARAAEDVGEVAAEASTESIEEAAKREMEKDLTWRRHEAEEPRRTEREKKAAWEEHEAEKRHPGYDVLPPEDRAKAIKHEVPIEIIRAAAEHGYSLDYLIHAKSSHAAGERLRKLGIDWGAEKPEEPARVEDPRIRLLRQGQLHRKTVEDIIKEIEEKPGELRKSLRPVGGRIPLARGARQYLKAWRIYRNWKKTRDSGQLYSDGLLGLGGEHRRRIRKFLERHDQEIALSRSKLNLINRHELNVLLSDRRHLAERILRLHRQQEAFDRNSIDPTDVYAHDQFKKEFKEYLKTPSEHKGEHDKYAEFHKGTPEEEEPHDVAGV